MNLSLQIQFSLHALNNAAGKKKEKKKGLPDLEERSFGLSSIRWAWQRIEARALVPSVPEAIDWMRR